MERVSTLIRKLQQQLDVKASARQLLHTAHMLQAELQSQCGSTKEANQDKVSVIMPLSFHVFEGAVAEAHLYPNNQEEKVVEVLQVDEKEIEEELEQIKRNAEAVNSMVTNARPSFVYDPIAVSYT